MSLSRCLFVVLQPNKILSQPFISSLFNCSMPLKSTTPKLSSQRLQEAPAYAQNGWQNKPRPLHKMCPLAHNLGPRAMGFLGHWGQKGHLQDMFISWGLAMIGNPPINKKITTPKLSTQRLQKAPAFAQNGCQNNLK